MNGKNIFLPETMTNYKLSYKQTKILKDAIHNLLMNSNHKTEDEINEIYELFYLLERNSNSVKALCDY